jgi:hypothetical protein
VIYRLATAVLLGLWLYADTARSEDAPTASELASGFLRPPPSARPWVYWFWMDGNITRQGITADLEAMQRVGLGGVLLMDVSQGLPHGPVQFNGPEWRSLFQHAVSEAGRLGLELSLHNSAGWSGSSGPWITPEFSMQKLVSTKTNLTGPRLFVGKLPRFAGVSSNVWPVATLAFPAPTGDGGQPPGFPPRRVTLAGEALDASKLFDHDQATFVSIPLVTDPNQRFLELEFSEPFTAASLRLMGAGQAQHFGATLQASENGRAYHEVREGRSRGSGLFLAFEQTKARFFRVAFTSVNPELQSLQFSELELEPAYRIPWFQSKTGAGPMPARADSASLTQIPNSAAIKPEQVVDLSARVDATGTLTWQVPDGAWTILQIASSPIGTTTRTVWPQNSGLESDKLSREALKVHFDEFVGQLASLVGKQSAFKATHIDSWEIGFQNWSPRLADEFKQRRGYDPLPYFPALTGRFVGSAEQSERFLWDIRRTIADLVADNYGGYMAELAHERGLQLSIEGYASLGKGPFDELQYAGRADSPMAEFWFGTNDLAQFELRSMPSAAHTYGKRLVAAEAFTSEAAYSKWLEHPALLKPLADAAFCEGVNRLVIHRYAHQPWLNCAPGMTMGPFGLHYERTQTWWAQSKPWHEYLTRCQYLLQQGLAVADACYLTAETPFAPVPRRDQLSPPLPTGYNYDLASPEVILSRMSVRDGRLVLPDGMAYQVLVLPDSSSMRPQLLKKVKELVAAGATVVGRPPTISPSLAGYPQCDVDVKQIAADLWARCDGKSVTQNQFGRGKAIWGSSMEAVFLSNNITPDFQSSPRARSSPLRWIHRQVGSVDLYFVANPNADTVVADCQFRISGRVPELWDPETGQTEVAGIWHQQQGLTHVELDLKGGSSVFVVFNQSSNGADPVTELRRDGQTEAADVLSVAHDGARSIAMSRPGAYSAKLASGKTLKTRVDQVTEPIKFVGPWQLMVPAGSGAPVELTLNRLVSWTTQTNSAVRFFSGTATYETTFDLPAELLAPAREFLLDLGRVEVIAELQVNEVDFGVLWRAPFGVDVTRALKPGPNRLRVKVTNLWPNRLIGDEFLPEDCVWDLSRQTDEGYPILEWPGWLQRGEPRRSGRTTFTTWKHWQKDSQLLQSGLLGPVTLRVLERRKLE